MIFLLKYFSPQYFAVTLILIIDWKCGMRMFFTHITARSSEPIHIENAEQREKRLKRKGLEDIQVN